MAGLLDSVRAELGLAGDGGLELVGDPNPAVLASPLAVADCATAAVGACLTAAADLAAARTGRRPAVALDTAHVAAAVRSEAWLRDPDGKGVSGFAPLSRLWPTADGWARTHANYPWHRTALLAALGIADGPDDDVAPRLADAMAHRPAGEVEETVYAAGGLAVAARTAAEWSGPGGPLVRMAPLGGRTRPLGPGQLPAAGVKVLDLTRVIAGPVGTRMLAALGARVLRVDDPGRPELPGQTVEGVLGKASTVIDAGTGELRRLLGDADVLVTGYRPGALRRFGLDPDQVADRYPQLTVVTLSAWGDTPGWAGRRGFDSLVQIASGIGWATSPDGARPGTLPCQLLDHATGYLIAAGTLAALAGGVAAHVSVSLARTARWLLDQGTAPDATGPESDPDAYRVDLGDGWSAIAPPGRLDGRPLRWPHLPPRYGQAPPAWPDRTARRRAVPPAPP